MIKATTNYQVCKLETASSGDYSYLEATQTGAVRMSVIKHNGGYFYCFANEYVKYRRAADR